MSGMISSRYVERISSIKSINISADKTSTNVE